MLKDQWFGLYQASLKGVISARSFQHPAKYAWGLITKIYRHAIEEGWLVPGSVVLDPMAGVGIGGLAAAEYGLRFVGIELEPRFQRLAQGYDCPGLSKAEWVRWFNRYSRHPGLCETCQQEAQGWYAARITPPAQYDLELGTAMMTQRGLGIIPERAPHRFVGNFDLHHNAWLASGAPLPVVIQGDARRLREIVTEVGLVVSSPPYAGKGEVLGGHNGIDYTKSQTGGKRSTPTRLASGKNYGQTEGQIGQMPPGDLALILSSPPYADGCRQTGGIDQHPEHIKGGHRGHVLRSYREASAIISSPPYANSVNAETCGIDWTKMGPATGKRKRGPGTKHHETLMQQLSYQSPSAIVSSPPFIDARQNTTPSKKGKNAPTKHDPEAWSSPHASGATLGQLGSMPEGSLAAIVTSPPYAEGLSKEHTYQDHGKREKDSHRRIMTEKGVADPFYGTTAGNLGNANAESYWSEIAKVYQSCFDVLPPHGHMILVLKGYIRRRQYVDLPAQTVQLLEHVGFTVLHWHEACLTSQIGQLTFDGGETRKSKKSFFRRLQEKKNPEVKVDFEVVVCAVKP